MAEGEHGYSTSDGSAPDSPVDGYVSAACTVCTLGVSADTDRSGTIASDALSSPPTTTHRRVVIGPQRRR